MAAVLQPDWKFRDMGAGDLDRVIALEHAAYPFPWTRGIFADCLRVGYVCRVVALDEEVLAYSVLTASAGEAHLLNLCVAAAARGQGIGRLLLEHAVQTSVARAAERLFLEVRPSNVAALQLYRANGFRVIGRRPGYYPAPEGREDAVVMVRTAHPIPLT